MRDAEGGASNNSDLTSEDSGIKKKGKRESIARHAEKRGKSHKKACTRHPQQDWGKGRDLVKRPFTGEVNCAKEFSQSHLYPTRKRKPGSEII